MEKKADFWHIMWCTAVGGWFGAMVAKYFSSEVQLTKGETLVSGLFILICSIILGLIMYTVKCNQHTVKYEPRQREGYKDYSPETKFKGKTYGSIGFGFFREED